jgi:hypothetical protein
MTRADISVARPAHSSGITSPNTARLLLRRGREVRARRMQKLIPPGAASCLNIPHRSAARIGHSDHLSRVIEARRTRHQRVPDPITSASCQQSASPNRRLTVAPPALRYSKLPTCRRDLPDQPSGSYWRGRVRLRMWPCAQSCSGNARRKIRSRWMMR